MVTLDKIQKRLGDIIRQSVLTQTELAKRLGIKQTQISCYVHGKKLPALDTFANLCAVLDVSPAYILCLTDVE